MIKFLPLFLVNNGKDNGVLRNKKDKAAAAADDDDVDGKM